MVALRNFFYYSVIFFTRCFINQIIAVITNDRTVCWNYNHIQIIDGTQLFRFCCGCTGHPRKFIIHSEIILYGDSSQSLGLSFDCYIFLGFQGLVQTITVSSSSKNTTGKFIHDLDTPILDHIFHIFFVKCIGSK